MPRSDCFVVPLSLLRMGEQMIPQLQWQRRAYPGLGICAIWLGNAQAMFDETLEYLKQRRGLPGPGQQSVRRRQRNTFAATLGADGAWRHG